jgi:cytochrome P450
MNASSPDAGRGAPPHQPPISYNPTDPLVRLDPYDAYARLRAENPVWYQEGAGIWFLSSHADCLRALREPRFSARLGQHVRQRADPLPESMLTTDPPEHTRLRGPVQAELAPGRVALLGAHLRTEAGALVSQWEDGEEVDLVSAFAVPLATGALGALLGMPSDDLERFGRLAAAAAPQLDPLDPPEPGSAASVAVEELLGWFADLLGPRRTSSTDDVMGALVRAYEAERLDAREVLAACSLLVVGGFEPLVDALSLGVWLQLRHGGVIRDDPGIVEEVLRYDAPIQFAARVALEDVAFDGTVVEAGQSVVVLLGSANRDPERFVDPDVFEPARSPNPHLAFGAGPHHCPGAAFTRLVAGTAASVLAETWPRTRLARDPVRRDTLVPRGLSTLPVSVGR